MSSQPRPARLTANAFLAWAAEQPRGRYELVDGQVVAMSPERAGHARAKARVHHALEAAIAAAGLACEAFPDGMSVRVDEGTVYEPDALPRCGPPVPDDAVEIADPVVIVEVVSPSTRAVDSNVKLDGYFRTPAVAHYLIVNAAGGTVVHHRRAGAGVETRILRDGALDLDPPGVLLPLAALFPPSR